MTAESVDGFLRQQKESGASADSLRQRKGFVTALYNWLPGDKELTADALSAWREDMESKGYSPTTICNYAKGINRYLDYMGCPELRFRKGRYKDLRGLQFGSLTVLEPTGERSRRTRTWRCRCVCGKEITVPSGSLIQGNTTSCGCLPAKVLRSANQYIDGTSLRQSLQDDPPSSRRGAASGYTGVVRKRGKWQAVIRYKGVTHYLGQYSQIGDAVKARARGKARVQEDAAQLQILYQELYSGEEPPQRPPKPAPIPYPEKKAESTGCPVRSDNTSGYPGVFKKRDKWSARITVGGKLYTLGSYENIEDAIAIRRQAEQAAARKDTRTLELLRNANQRNEDIRK